MAKLLKASTVLKRSKAVDLFELHMEEIAERILLSADMGETRLPLYLSPELYDETVKRLENAGYQVLDRELAQHYVTTCASPAKKGFFSKLLGNNENDEPYLLPEPYGFYVTVSWAGNVA